MIVNIILVLALSCIAPVAPQPEQIRVLVDEEVQIWDVEDYLRGVVPSEVYACCWQEDTLKAMAIIARTYAYWRIKNPRCAEYDIVSTHRDQVFLMRKVHPRTDHAIRATEGIVLVDENYEPIHAIYNKKIQWELEYAARQGADWETLLVNYIGRQH